MVSHLLRHCFHPTRVAADECTVCHLTIYIGVLAHDHSRSSSCSGKPVGSRSASPTSLKHCLHLNPETLSLEARRTHSPNTEPREVAREEKQHWSRSRVHQLAGVQIVSSHTQESVPWLIKGGMQQPEAHFGYLHIILVVAPSSPLMGDGQCMANDRACTGLKRFE